MDWNANNTESMEGKSFPEAKNAKKLVKYPPKPRFLMASSIESIKKEENSLYHLYHPKFLVLA